MLPTGAHWLVSVSSRVAIHSYAVFSGLSTEQYDVKHIVNGDGARWATDGRKDRQTTSYYVVTVCVIVIYYIFFIEHLTRLVA